MINFESEHPQLPPECSGFFKELLAPAMISIVATRKEEIMFPPLHLLALAFS